MSRFRERKIIRLFQSKGYAQAGLLKKTAISNKLRIQPKIEIKTNKTLFVMILPHLLDFLLDRGEVSLLN